MEAVGAAAAIAQLLGLSVAASKIVRHAVSSFSHAPAEIMELDRKLHSFHSLVMQVASLWAELPESQTSVPLLSDHQMQMFSTSMQNVSDTVTRMRNANKASTNTSCNVRDRLRWAVLDKKKAQSFLRNTQAASSELNVMLQVLNSRISSMTQSSVLALSVSHAETKQVLEDIKAIILTDRRQSKSPEFATIMSNESPMLDFHPIRSAYRNQPWSRVIEHNMEVTRTYPIVSLGHRGRPITSNDALGRMGADVMVEWKRRSQKAKLLFNMAIRLFGHHILQFEVQAQLLCRSWTLSPSINSSITIINIRPSQSPIFRACQTWNMEEVHYLFETGEAGINDADEEIGGLLDHVVSGRVVKIGSPIEEMEFLQGGQSLLEYLICRGCNPSIIHGASRNPLPAILRAFQDGYRAATCMMLSNGADLLSFGDRLGGLFNTAYTSESQFLWQVDLLRSISYSDWKFDNSMSSVSWGHSRWGANWHNLNNLLYGASWVGHIDISLFALEVAGIDPNQVGKLNCTPIGNAAQKGCLDLIAMLLHYGAYVNINEWDWHGTPLHRSIRGSGILTDASHYLLLRGADPMLRDFQGLSAFSHIITNHYSPETFWGLGFSYIAFEGSITHLLYHGSDPFEVFATDHRKRDDYAYPSFVTWFDLLWPLQASDIARFRSYGLRRRWGYDSFLKALPEGISEMLNIMDDSRDFDWRFQWNDCGIISGVLRGLPDEGQPEFIVGSPACDETHEQCFDANMETRIRNSVPDPDATINEEGTFVPVWKEIDTEDPSSLDMGYLSGVSPGFFRNATAFYRHTLTLRGQRQLSRWPMVRALCDGLENAGYRVEMDDDGDLWYDCDDTDRYFDAWEKQPAEDREDWLVDVCPICQNFEEYGLGHILEIEKDMKEKIREYQRQVQEGKRRFF